MKVPGADHIWWSADGYFFSDETEGFHGPYMSQERAQFEFGVYCLWLEGHLDFAWANAERLRRFGVGPEFRAVPQPAHRTRAEQALFVWILAMIVGVAIALTVLP